MIDHKRELAEWCRQHQLQPPLYDREAVGPSTQVFIVFITVAFIDIIIPIISINIIIHISLNVVATRGRTPASCFAWPTG